MDTMTEITASVNRLVDEQRSRCLWFLRRDHVPRTPEETLRVLGTIERYGDREAFREAATLRRWLSLPSSAPSAGS